MDICKNKIAKRLKLKFLLFFYNHFKHISIKCGDDCEISHLKLASCGNGNSVILGDGVKLKDVTISVFGNQNQLIIHSNNNISKVRFVMEDDDNKIEIGEHNYIGSDCLLAALEGTTISIGSNCMIASPCEIRTSDSHSLLDSDGQRINYAKDIVLGGHVWIGMGCLILKGAYIPEDCVVAAKSVVCSMENVNKGSLLGGTPARILKENINWNHKRIK